MKLSFNYKGTKISYSLMYKKTTAISINIDLNRMVNVVAPLGTSVQTVMDKVKGNAPWIIEELYRGSNQKNRDTILTQYTYLGKNYGVEITSKKDLDKIVVKLVRGKFVIQTPTDNQKEIRKALLVWYKDKVTIKLKERLKVYAELFQEVPQEIIISNNEAIFFESKNNIIYVNVAIGMLTIEMIDYLLVYELCKLNYPIEQHEDTKKLKEIVPQYEECKKWLEKNKAYLLL